MPLIPNATLARSQTVANLTVLREIHAIEEAVLIAISSGEVSATIGGDTTMTDTTGYDGSTETTSEMYYEVWQGTLTDATMAAEMATVIDYFKNLGYNIVRIQDITTETTFKWVVSW